MSSGNIPSEGAASKKKRILRELPRVLFLNAPFDRADPRCEAGRMPLGQMAIASNLRRIAEVMVVDASVLSESELNSRIREFSPHHLGITLYDQLLPQTKKMIGWLKAVFPEAVVSVGGPMATISPEVALYHCRADAVFAGEAEETFREFIRLVGTGEGFRKVQAIRNIEGLYFFDESGDLVACKGRPHIPAEILENLPFDLTLARDLVREGTFHLSTSRGCPFGCVFCTKVHGGRYRAWNAGRVVKTLEDIRRLVRTGILPKIEKISIHDDDFFFDRQRILEIARSISKKRLAFRFDVQSNVFSFFRKGEIDTELLDAVGSMNIACIRFGTDSLNQNELQRLRKPFRDPEKIKLLVEETARRGINTIHYLILTTPQTKAADFMDCLFAATELQLRFGCRFMINHYIIPIAGSPFYLDLIRDRIPFSFIMEGCEGAPQYDYPIGICSSISDPVVLRTLFSFTERQARNTNLDTHIPSLYLPLFYKHLRKQRKYLQEAGRSSEVLRLRSLEDEWKRRFADLVALTRTSSDRFSSSRTPHPPLSSSIDPVPQ